jgi:predicted lysophospholipase L1 biosynthesis ABC-type transport system permease subunit
MQTQFKNIDPPMWVAWNQAKASIRVRFLRMLITSIGVALGIAFFSSMEVLAFSPVKAGMQSHSQMQWLTGTSLVMCLVGVTNSMLMSVTERYREIGTIKCLGASDSFIVKVFFLEALLLGAIGSFGGALIGTLLMAAVMAATTGGPGVGSIGLVLLIGTGVGMLMTVLAAVAPAIQASKMPAAAALRVDV